MLLLLYGISRKVRAAIPSYLSMLGIVITGFAIPVVGFGTAFGEKFIVDKMAVFFKMIFLGAAFFAVSSRKINEEASSDHGEYFALGISWASCVSPTYMNCPTARLW